MLSGDSLHPLESIFLEINFMIIDNLTIAGIAAVVAVVVLFLHFVAKVPIFGRRKD
jgi:hypothetical protein